MSSRILTTVDILPIPSGSAEYEATRSSILQEFAASIPKEFVISKSIIANPPINFLEIPRNCGILSALELDITEYYDAYGFAAAIASKKFTAVQVTTAFAKRAIIAHQLTSCLTEWFLDEALDQAKALDQHLLTTGQTVGPLHGVPISLKAHLPILGHWSDLGFLATIKKDKADCHMVSILRQAGAVFYCKTNQPQGIMHLETVSLYGRVLNPYNINLSAGGSSGGEAALIALRGSVLGVASDSGGSIRGPASFCGIYGFKPTTYTHPIKDFLSGSSEAALGVACSLGPMCTSLRDINLFMSTISAAQPQLLDPRIIPLRWPGDIIHNQMREPIRIGFMMDDGVIMPQPPVTRALLWIQSRLEKNSTFLIKQFESLRTEQAIKSVRTAYWPDGGIGAKAQLAKGGDPVLPLTE